jgi:hypothetical protein
VVTLVRRASGRRGLPFLVMGVVLGCALPAGAQSAASVRDTAAARALFREGVACADRSDWPCAVDRFHRAHQLRPSPVLAYNLGHALVEIGRLVEGAEILHRLVRDETAPARVRADASRVVDAAAPRIGSLTVHVEGPTDGVVFAIDEHELATSLLGAAAPVDPGERRIEARRGDEVIASASVVIAEGGTESVTLALPEPPAEDPAVASLDVPTPSEVALGASPSEPTDAPPAGGDDGPWIALGIGGAVVLVAGAIVLAVVLAQPGEQAPFDGSLGHVEIGR